MLILTIIVGLLIAAMIIFAIVYNAMGLYRQVRSKKFNKALFEKYGRGDSEDQTDFWMDYKDKYEIRYELRDTHYDRSMPYRTFLELKLKESIPGDFNFHIRPKGYEMHFNEESIRLMEIETEGKFSQQHDFWGNQSVYANLLLHDDQVFPILREIQSKYKSLMLSIEPNKIELQLAGMFSDPKDLSPIEELMEDLVIIWEQLPKIIIENNKS